jgi:hypothetical protein
MKTNLNALEPFHGNFVLGTLTVVSGYSFNVFPESFCGKRLAARREQRILAVLGSRGGAAW